MGLRLRLTRPCSAAFEEMPADGRARHCAQCHKSVHDLSSGTEEEARALFREADLRGERVCVRYTKTPDGTVRFRAMGLVAAMSIAACSAPVEPQPEAQPQPQTEPQAGGTPQDAEDHDMGDAIPDQIDICPDPPEPGGDEDGCPEPPPKP